MRMDEGKIFALIIAMLLVIVIILSLGYVPKARVVPLAVALPTLALALYQILLEFDVLGQKKKDFNDSAKAAEKMETNLKSYRMIFTWILLFIVMLFLIGFFPAIAVFMFLYLKLQGKESWLVSICMPGAALVVVYLAFVFGLHIDFYGGLLGELVLNS